MLDNRAFLMPITSERSGSVTGSSTAAPSGNSSLALRLQAANLMQQIKNDMRGSKRLFSGDTEFSRYTHAEDERTDLSASVLEKSQQSICSSGSHERSRRKPSKTGSPRRPSSTSRHHPSPRKFSRSVSDDRERSLVLDMSNMSIEAPWQTEGRSVTTRTTSPAPNPNIPHIRITSSATFPQPPTQIPRSYPSSSIRSGNNDDLNRFVSSSTASGTTITASSAPSFVKHAGPVHITHITPSDIPSLPQRVGKMVYDKDLMKWMRASARVSSDGDDLRDHISVTDAESEDPFRDIDSLREDDSGGSVGIAKEAQVGAQEAEEVEEEAHFKQHPTRIEEEEEEDSNDQEEVGLISFTFDGPSVAQVRMVPSGEDDTEDDTTVSDSEEDEGAGTDAESAPAPLVFDSEDDISNDSPNQQSVEATPVAPRRVSTVTTPMPPKSALKSASVTPISAMKDPNRDKYRTPAQRKGHRRSVSFSDGQRDGPIRGLTAKPHESDDDVGTSLSSFQPTPTQSSSYPPSARSKRIAEMMHNLEHTGKIRAFLDEVIVAESPE